MKKIIILLFVLITGLQSNFYAQGRNGIQPNFENRFQIGYSLDAFNSGVKPWHTGSLEYEKKIDLNSIIPRINYTRRYDLSDFQFESDAYVFLTKNTYTYLNAGISNNKIFPKYRLGIEPYQNLPDAFEASLGIRFLVFNNNDVKIYTGSVGKYLGNYWISFRPFFVPEAGKLKITYNIQSRKYFADKYNYLELRFGWGKFSTQELTLDEVERNNSILLGIDYQFYIIDNSLLNIGFAFQREEFGAQIKRNKYTLELRFLNFL